MENQNQKKRMDKMTFSKNILLVLLLMLLSRVTPVLAEPYTSEDICTEKKTLSLLNQAWHISDLTHCGDPDKLNDYDKATNRWENDRTELIKHIVSSYENGNTKPFKAFKNVYNLLDDHSRDALKPIYNDIRSSGIVDGNRLYFAQSEYYPGYGYSKSGYKYRRGRELERESKGFYWQDEQQNHSSNVNIDLVINTNLLSMVQSLLTGGFIKNLTIGKPFPVNVDGSNVMSVKVSFQSSNNLSTNVKRKFEVCKVWFELESASSFFMSSGPWQLCGKTFTIVHESTGEQVVNEIKPQ
ncbi:MAG: hypothetical protein HQM10_08170 [Candidatus Riflebacteria bacterium]|nr:hypothetical protein [Candidatus Riflebacteria bacterium]